MLKENSTRLSMSLVIGLLCCFLLVHGSDERKYDEEAGKAYLKKINADIQVQTTKSVLASWAYESNITDENLRVQLDVSAKLANYTKDIWKETIKFPWKTFKDPDVRRQFQKFSVLGTAILSPQKYERFNKIISDMQSIYGKAKLCNYKNASDCSLQLEPELTEIFVKSRDPDELRYYWQQWRNSAGKPVREMYKEYVDLSNEAAVLNNFTNNADFWLKDYEAKDFKQQVENLWQQLRPLYLQLHAYVRRRLREQYGENHVTKRGPIPAHLLGNMWAQSWGNIFDFTAPYPGKPSMDVTPAMVEQGYTPLRMFKLAEEFFTSLNLSPMPETFWKNSILEKPNDGRDLICHASAWDFYDGEDFRIKQCTRITMEDLNTVHHEMGHIQYFLQYKNQPIVYKEGTNPGFHEAVGDVMALSVSTPKHLRKIGLLNATEDDAESEINQLYNMALDKVAFLPYGYLMDQWRWSVFEGKTTERDYNCKWWQLREKYQGLSPSVVRTEEDFDPGAKYHTVGNVPYIRYFVSFVIQFQFHRSLCIAAKEFDPANPASKPLHKCDIYQSKEAGALLKKMLQMGSSKPWPDAMEVITGQREMDARALLDYFGTLYDWLQKENERTGEFIGWESSQSECKWEEGQRATPVETQGNFEDDNIAYSYAEFVRQDDNAFGFPDYLEEVQPSYHALQHRSKENEFRANYFIPKKADFPAEQNIYIAEPSFVQGRTDYIDVSRLQRLKSRLQNQPEVGISDGDRYNLWQYSEQESPTFEKRAVNRDAKNTEIINAILEDVQNLEKSREPSLTKKDAYKWIANRDLDGNVKKTENTLRLQGVVESDQHGQPLPVFHLNKTEEAIDSREKTGPGVLEDQNEEVQSVKEIQNIQEDPNSDTDNAPEVIDEQGIQDTQDLQNMQEQDSLVTPEAQDISKSSDSNILEGVRMKDTIRGRGKAECILETAKKFGLKTLDNQVPNDLMWKAELVKNEAEQMLKNFNLTFYSPNYTNITKGWLHPFRSIKPVKDEGVVVPPHTGLKNTRNILPLYSTPEHIKRRKSYKLNFNSLESFLKPSILNKKSFTENKKQFPFKEYDLVDVIPVNDLLKTNAHKLQGKRSPLDDSNEFTYIILVGKLSDKQQSDYEKKMEKRSYKEYHYNIKTPVVYNTVTIVPPGGKSDRTDELREHWSKESKRNARLLDRRKEREEWGLGSRTEEETGEIVFGKKISRSVRKNKYNINNIVQYLRCLQILL